MSSPSPFDLTGRRALVTGSTRGIGAAIAEALARAGATVVVHGRDAAGVERAVSQVREQLAAEGVTATLLGVAFDVTDQEAMHRALEELDGRLHGIDVLVNNAGMQFRSSVIDLPLAAWEAVFATNVTSCLLLSQSVARGMLERGQGKIINVCSVQNRIVRNATAAYAAAKSALGTLGQVMCADWASRNIQINGLAPGYIETDLNQALLADPEMSAWVVRRTPAGRWGRPADLGGPAVWLASSASDFVNGQLIFVDGGMTAVI